MSELMRLYEATSQHLRNLGEVLLKNPPGSELYEYALKDYKGVLDRWEFLAYSLKDPGMVQIVEAAREMLRQIESKHSAQA